MSGDLVPGHGWIRRYVDLWTPHGEAPASAHLGAALAVLSAAIGWRAHIRWGDSAEPVTLFVMMEGGSSVAKKTTTARTAAGMARRAVAGMEGDPGLSVRSVGHTSQRGLLELVGTSEQEKAEEWERVPPPGVLLDWDEFGAVLGRPGDVKGADWLGQVRASLMQMYGGRHGGAQTAGAKILPSRCAVAILATMTRAELEQRVSLGLMRDGFMGRFVLIPHPGRRAWLAEPPRWSPVDSQVRDDLAKWLGRLARSHDELGSVFARQTVGARTTRGEWYEGRGRELEAAADAGGEPERAVADAFGRLQTTAAKVSAVVAASELADDEHLYEIQVEESHVRYGIELAERALSELRSLAEGGSGMPSDRYAGRLLDYLARRNGRGPVSRKQLMDDVRMDGLDGDARWRVVERLHQDGSLEIRKEPTGGRARVVVARAE